MTDEDWNKQEDWNQQMERLDERTAQRRARAKQLDEEMQKEIKQAEERRDRGKPAG